MGFNVNKLSRKQIIIALAVVGVLLWLWARSLPPGGYEKRPAGGDERSALAVSDLQWYQESTGNPDVAGPRYIVGTVTNNSDKQFAYVQVQINLYDEAGNQIESTTANVNNLEPHGNWRFKALVLENNAVSAKVKEVTGY
jgi:hypothetical protein